MVRKVWIKVFIVIFFISFATTFSYAGEGGSNNGLPTNKNNEAPAFAIQPIPPDGATMIAIDHQLSWSSTNNTVSFDIYFGITNPPPYVTNTMITRYNPGTLSYGTTYYWRINSKNSAGTTIGNIWSFKTQTIHSGQKTLAGQEPSEKITSPTPENKKSRSSIGFGLSSIKYDEYPSSSSADALMTEEGNMLSIFASSTNYTDSNSMTIIEGRIGFGTVNYDGQTQAGTPLTGSGINDLLIEVRGLRCKLGNLGASPDSFTYFGLGYRYLKDDASTMSGGYKRESNYFYIPLGIEGNNLNKTEQGWQIGGTFEMDIFLLGKQISHLSDADPGFKDMTNSQRSGWGMRFAPRLTKKTANGSVSVELFFINWNIEKSEEETITYYGSPVGVGYEPYNESYESGISLTIKF